MPFSHAAIFLVLVVNGAAHAEGRHTVRPLGGAVCMQLAISPKTRWTPRSACPSWRLRRLPPASSATPRRTSLWRRRSSPPPASSGWCGDRREGLDRGRVSPPVARPLHPDGDVLPGDDVRWETGVRLRQVRESTWCGCLSASGSPACRVPPSHPATSPSTVAGATPSNALWRGLYAGSQSDRLGVKFGSRPGRCWVRSGSREEGLHNCTNGAKFVG